MRRFDYSFLKTCPIPGSVCNMAMNIAALEERHASRLRDETILPQYDRLLDDAIMRSVRHSNAIEGIEADADRLSAVVGKTDVPCGHNERELLGYTDALAWVHANAKDTPLTTDGIRALHRLKTAPLGALDAGQYKSEDNVIMHIHADGSRSVRFSPVSAAETPDAMTQLLYAYDAARGDAGIPPLLLIPCVILDFLCIHPFADGNGRVSRLVTLWLLYRHGYDALRYVSLDEKTDSWRGYYYDALGQSSVGWHDNNNDYLPFLEHSLMTLFLCERELEEKIKGKEP